MTDETLKAMTRRYRQLAGVMLEIETEMKEISQAINDELPVGFTMDVDGIPISKRQGRRQFSLPLAVALLDPEEREACKRTMFDKDQVRAIIEDKGLLDDAMEDAGNAPIVRLR